MDIVFLPIWVELSNELIWRIHRNNPIFSLARDTCWSSRCCQVFVNYKRLLLKSVSVVLNWNSEAFLPSYIPFLSAQRMQSVASTACSTGGEDTCSRKHRLPALPCSWWRLTCLSTSPSGSQLTCGPTLEARPSHSVCLTTGKSFQAVPLLMAPSPTR